MVLTPLQAKKMMGPRQFKTMPVPYVTIIPGQMGMGHGGMGCGCGCKGQRGGDFLGIGKAFSKVGKAITSNPLRLAGAIGTLGMSEAFLTPAQLIGDSLGVKPSKALGVAAPFLGAAFGPEMGMASKGTAQVMGMMGQGKGQGKKKRVVKRKVAKRGRKMTKGRAKGRKKK